MVASLFVVSHTQAVVSMLQMDPEHTIMMQNQSMVGFWLQNCILILHCLPPTSLR